MIRVLCSVIFVFFSSRRRHTRLVSDWSSDVCSSDLEFSSQVFFKRALLEKYLRGELPQSAMAVSTITKRTQENHAPSSRTDFGISLVPIQTGGSRRPFFYLHVHWIGGAFYSFSLAQVLGSDQPLYVINPAKFDD